MALKGYSAPSYYLTYYPTYHSPPNYYSPPSYPNYKSHRYGYGGGSS